MKIETSVALVTGANRGIGRSIVACLARSGASRIYATARAPKALEAVVAIDPKRIVALTLDVTNERDVEAAAKRADQRVRRRDEMEAGAVGIFAHDLGGEVVTGFAVRHRRLTGDGRTECEFEIGGKQEAAQRPVAGRMADGPQRHRDWRQRIATVAPRLGPVKVDANGLRHASP